MKNPIEGATISPGDFPLGSAKSRAVARALLRLRRPAAFVAETDEEGRPIFEADQRYGENIVLAPRKLTAEEWARENAPKPRPDPDKTS